MDEINTGYNSLDDVEVNSGSRECPPANDYGLAISGADLKKTRSGGFGIQFVYTVIGDGTFDGYEIKEFVNVQNSNKTAEDIGRSHLKTLYEITGKTNAQSHTELIGAVMRGRCAQVQESFKSEKGEDITFNKLVVKVFMNSKGENALGKDMGKFDASKYPAPPPINNSNNNANSGGGSSISQENNNSNDDIDDEIPF